MPKDVEPALETSINVSLHGVSESSAVIETDRRNRESRRSSEAEPETTRRLFPCAAARVWYTAKEKDYDLVVRCLQMEKTDRETLTMLHQALADFALQRALATPGVQAAEIKQEAISTAEQKRKEEYEAELKRGSRKLKPRLGLSSEACDSEWKQANHHCLQEKRKDAWLKSAVGNSQRLLPRPPYQRTSQQNRFSLSRARLFEQWLRSHLAPDRRTPRFRDRKTCWSISKAEAEKRGMNKSTRSPRTRR